MTDQPTPQTEAGPKVTWTPANRSVLALLAPIADGLCSGCGAEPSRETGSCRCLFAVDSAIRGNVGLPYAGTVASDYHTVPLAQARTEALDVDAVRDALHGWLGDSHRYRPENGYLCERGTARVVAAILAAKADR